jgi:hypothetical protein
MPGDPIAIPTKAYQQGFGKSRQIFMDAKYGKTQATGVSEESTDKNTTPCRIVNVARIPSKRGRPAGSKNRKPCSDCGELTNTGTWCEKCARKKLQEQLNSLSLSFSGSVHPSPERTPLRESPPASPRGFIVAEPAQPKHTRGFIMAEPAQPEQTQPHESQHTSPRGFIEPGNFCPRCGKEMGEGGPLELMCMECERKLPPNPNRKG